MTSYISRSGGQKKKNILRQKELALRGDLRREATCETLQRRAAEVRSAHLGVIKALLEEARPVREEDEEGSTVTLQRLEKAREHWENVPLADIIRSYSTKTDDVPFVDRKKWWDFRPR